MILEAAIDHPQCRGVLSTKKYTTSSTPEHPEGIRISNWFLRRIEDKDTGGEVDLWKNRLRGTVRKLCGKLWNG